ncbi:hypothetical protein [Cysteiniphilum litorale]|uniref:hypothetical protein n=1 Tax=Cysteiniphilum litorale TaxID=2056700 RepID=UPI003F8805CA
MLATSQISATTRRVVICFALLFFLAFTLSVFHFLFYVHKERHVVTEMINASEKSIQVMYSDLLGKLSLALEKVNTNRSNFLSDMTQPISQGVQKVLSDYQWLFKSWYHTSLNASLFWLSTVDKNDEYVYIDQHGVRYIASGHDKDQRLVQIINHLNSSLQHTTAEEYVMCHPTRFNNIVTGKVCVVCESMLSLYKQNKDNKEALKNLFEIKRLDSDDIKFEVLLKHPVFAYGIFLVGHIIYYLCAVALAFLIICAGFFTSRRCYRAYQQENHCLNKKLACLEYFFEEIEMQQLRQLNPSQKDTLEASSAIIKRQLTRGDIEICVDFFMNIIKEKNIKVNYQLDKNIKHYQCCVFALQRLLLHFLSQSIYLAVKNTVLSISVGVEKNKLADKPSHIKLIYTDSNYVVNSDKVAKKLEGCEFYLNQEEMNAYFGHLGAKIDETYAIYEARRIKLLLPCFFCSNLSDAEINRKVVSLEKYIE